MKKMYQTGVDMIRSTILTIIFTFIFIFDLSARESISIVGSSTVYPFSTTVAEEFGRKNASFKSPIVESTGSGGGLKLFCSGLGPNTPDITNASRRIKLKEISLCKSNGVKDIIEIKIGFDGIVFANSKNGIDLELTTKDIYLALAKEVPCGAQDDVTCENQSKLWSDVNSELPELPIMVYGPPPTSGTRDAFVEIAMTDGCNSISWIKDLKKKNKNEWKKLCRTIREDGKYIEAGENDNLIIQKLNSNKNSFGIFGFSFLDQNSDQVKGTKINGVYPTFDAIAIGDYKISRSLYFYVKKAHIGSIPGIEEFLTHFVSEDAIGEDGYLIEKGLIPLPEDELLRYENDAKSLANMRY